MWQVCVTYPDLRSLSLIQSLRWGRPHTHARVFTHARVISLARVIPLARVITHARVISLARVITFVHGRSVITFARA